MSAYSAAPLKVGFSAGAAGPWRIELITAIVGDGLPDAERMRIVSEAPADTIWTLYGATSNARYTQRREVDALASRQEGLSRPDATCAALIPIRKSPAWWALAQDERRAIFEEQSHHIAIGMDYLPAIARRLHHCRDLGEPFDFLTWFEYAPAEIGAFDDLLRRLRASKEWDYVDREVDVRLTRTTPLATA